MISLLLLTAMSVKLKIKYYIIPIIFVLLGIGVDAYAIEDSYRYGLTFNSRDKEKDERTSFSIDDIKIDDYFRLDFDWTLNDEYFGYIYRVIIDDTLNIDLIVNFIRGTDTCKSPPLIVVANNKKLHRWETEIGRQWNRSSLTILPKEDSISVGYKGEEVTFPFKLSTKERRISVQFGLISQHIM